MQKAESFVPGFLRRHSLISIALLLAGLVNSFVSFLLPVSIGEFFTIHYHTKGSKRKLLSWIGIHLYTLEGFYTFFIILLLLKTVISFIENQGNSRQGELFVKNIREKLFAAQMNWSPDLLAKNSFGKYLLRYSNDMKALQNYFTKGIIGGIKNLVFLLTGIFMLSRINFTLTLILVLILLAILGITWFIAGLQKPAITVSRTHRSSLLAFVAKTFSKFHKLKQNQTESNAIDDFNTKSENLFHANMRSSKIESLLQSSSYFLVFSMVGILLWQMTMPYSHISASDGLMMMLMVLMMQGAINRILKVPGYINKGKISLEKINKVIQTKITEPEPAKIVALTS